MWRHLAFLLLVGYLPICVYGNRGGLRSTDAMITNSSSFSTNFMCTIGENCSGKGVWSQETDRCFCFPGYLTIDSQDQQCSYEQKSQGYAAFLAFVVPYAGASYFYVGDYELGTLQLLFGGLGFPVLILIGYGIIVLLDSCILRIKTGECKTSSPSYSGMQLGFVLGCVFGIVWLMVGIIWWIVSSTNALNGDMVDGNGYPLYPMYPSVPNWVQ